MTEFPFFPLIRKALLASPEQDLRVLSRRVLSMIPVEQQGAVLAQCIYRAMCDENRHIRNTPSLVSAETREARTAAQNPGESRWKRLAPALRVRYSIAGTWKSLADCSAEDCDVLARDYADRAASNAALERKFRALADEMRATGVKTVAQLSGETLTELDLGVAA